MDPGVRRGDAVDGAARIQFGRYPQGVRFFTQGLHPELVEGRGRQCAKALVVRQAHRERRGVTRLWPMLRNWQRPSFLAAKTPRDSRETLDPRSQRNWSGCAAHAVLRVGSLCGGPRGHELHAATNKMAGGDGWPGPAPCRRATQWTIGSGEEDPPGRPCSRSAPRRSGCGCPAGMVSRPGSRITRRRFRRVG